jgi:ribosomal protein L11 methylase PrmA
MTVERVRGSYRDPSGFVFHSDGTIYRQVNHTFAEEFEACESAGLYGELSSADLLIGHERVALDFAVTPEAHAVLRPARIDFISYPYEWSFGELKDAALLTLEVQKRALQRGFVLRDASAYNVQFRDGRPVFIDTLSFERRAEGQPWRAYKQFCEHFLVPLALMSHTDVRCQQLLRAHLDGIPLDLGSHLLPSRAWLMPSLLLHIHLHARAAHRYREASVSTVAGTRTVSTRTLVGLTDSLRGAIERLDWRPTGTQWADYAHDHNYTEAALEAKRQLVRDFVAASRPRTVWDIGGNTGMFSRVARAVAPSVVCFDIDPAAVEINYRQVRSTAETGILPLLLDMMNPSPSLGWANEERQSLEARGPVDTVMALALVHHLAIANNVPLPRVAEAFARLGRTLVIEFVPKSDSQVVRLLRNRPDIFPDYSQKGFEQAFEESFVIEAREPIPGSERALYRMRRRAP